MPQAVKSKIAYSGYLRRSLPQKLKRTPNIEIDEPYILVTAGGGGDGAVGLGGTVDGGDGKAVTFSLGGTGGSTVRLPLPPLLPWRCDETR